MDVKSSHVLEFCLTSGPPDDAGVLATVGIPYAVSDIDNALAARRGSS